MYDFYVNEKEESDESEVDRSSDEDCDDTESEMKQTNDPKNNDFDVSDAFDENFIINDYHIDSDEKIQIIRCWAHTLQLAVNDVLKKIYVLFISKVRELCKKIRLRSLELKKSKKKKPPLDVDTRWQLAFYMMKEMFE